MALVVQLVAVQLFVGATSRAYATIAEDKVIKASATVQDSPPAITLTWTLDGGANQFQIYRKSKDSTNWGSAIAVCPADATAYVDTNVIVGTSYEYLVYKPVPTDPSPNGRFGLVYAGIEVPLSENRGTVVLIVDNSFVISLSSEIERFEQDLVGDGWTVARHDVDRSETVANVKTLIQNEYTADPEKVRAVLLFGHVPVPYSGDIYPDGHSNHRGAWPADVFYGDMDGVWTDSTVNRTSASREANHNVPGDGKYDQSYIPSSLELTVGRVDLADMPAFSLGEEGLLRQYLDKNHDFRHKTIEAQARGLVADNLTSMGEGFAQNGWRYAALFGTDNVLAGTWSTLLTDDYLWAYGCGAGNYTSANGVATTGSYAGGTYKAMFQMLFGSYFGDWDTTNSFLRAPLCNQTYGLATCWAGRPNWHVHHMAMGEPIGYGARISTGFGLYPMGSAATMVHIALMGDPTLRLHYVRPPSDLTVAQVNDPFSATLTWTASSDAGILGYHVYRSADPLGPYTRLTSELVTGTSYSEADPPIGDNTYMVRAVRLETSATGTYYNASQGMFATVEIVEVDSDGDGIPNDVEGDGDPDSDGIPNYQDTDSDGDAIPDEQEGTDDPDEDTIPNYLDDDSDGDAIPDEQEGTDDPDEDTIPNYLDEDSDGDAIPDEQEGTDDPDEDTIPNYLDDDSDGDGFSDAEELSSGTDPYHADETAVTPVVFWPLVIALLATGLAFTNRKLVR